MAQDQAGNLVADSQGTGWTVTSQQETFGEGPTGTAVPGVRVFFLTNRGIAGSVFVPRNLYNSDNVKSAINEYVQRLHAVDSLTG